MKKMKKEKTKLIYNLITNLSLTMLQFNKLLLEKHNIQIHSFHILDMANTTKSLPIKTLKEKLGLSSASLSRMLSNLYQKELIERSFSKDGDKRQIFISLSKKGEKKLEKIQYDLEEKINTENIQIQKNETINLTKNLKLIF